MKYYIFILAILVSSCGTSKKFSKSKENQKQELNSKEDLLNKYEEYVNSWLGTPYNYGECVKQKGTDCSGFIYTTYRDLFNIQIPRSTSEQYEKAKPRNFEQLKMGDLIFFDIKGKGASHVGMYLRDRMFIHASSSKGVIISSLDEEYYKKHFLSFGSFF